MTEVLDLKRRIRIQEPPVGYEPEGGDFQFEEEPPRKKKSGIWRWLIVTVLAVILATVGIKASDTLFTKEVKENSLCPEGMVFVPRANGGFCIDQYEASAGRSCANFNPSNQEQTRVNLENEACRPVSEAGKIPWRYISQNQAAIACAKAGKRLPSSEEWLAAALATSDRDANWTADDCQVASNWDKQPGLTGSGKNCVSGAGAYDMIGNVWEWVQGTAEDGEYLGQTLPDDGFIKGVDSYAMPTETDPDQSDPNYFNDYFWIKRTGARGIARGGYWGNNQEAGQYSVYAVAPPSEAGTGMGFRCAK